MTTEFCIFALVEAQDSHFHDGGRYHIETSPLICSANQSTGFCQWSSFYTITASVMKRLNSQL